MPSEQTERGTIAVSVTCTGYRDVYHDEDPEGDEYLALTNVTVRTKDGRTNAYPRETFAYYDSPFSPNYRLLTQLGGPDSYITGDVDGTPAHFDFPEEPNENGTYVGAPVSAVPDAQCIETKFLRDFRR